MQELSSLTRYEINAKLSPQDVRGAQIINIALAMGPVIFFLIILFLYYKNNPGSNSDYASNKNMINIFAITVTVLAAIEYSICYFLTRFQLAPARLKSKLSQPFYDQAGKEITEPIGKLMTIYRTQTIIRLAMMEGVALFGLVVLFIAATGGYVDEQPLIWFFAAPMAILVFYVYAAFPTKGRIVDFIENNILKKINQ